MHFITTMTSCNVISLFVRFLLDCTANVIGRAFVASLIMHQSFVTTVLHLRDRVGIAGLECGAITFQVSPQCRGNDGVLT